MVYCIRFSQPAYCPIVTCETNHFGIILLVSQKKYSYKSPLYTMLNPMGINHHEWDIPKQWNIYHDINTYNPHYILYTMIFQN